MIMIMIMMMTMAMILIMVSYHHHDPSVRRHLVATKSPHPSSLRLQPSAPRPQASGFMPHYYDYDYDQDYDYDYDDGVIS